MLKPCPQCKVEDSCKWGFTKGYGAHIIDYCTKSLSNTSSSPESLPFTIKRDSARYFPQPPLSWASLVAQLVKNPPVMQETWVHSLGWEDPLEEGMAIQSSILAWRIKLTEEPGGLQSKWLQRVGHN